MPFTAVLCFPLANITAQRRLDEELDKPVLKPGHTILPTRPVERLVQKLLQELSLQSLPLAPSTKSKTAHVALASNSWEYSAVMCQVQEPTESMG